MHLKMPSAEWRPFYPGRNELLFHRISSNISTHKWLKHLKKSNLRKQIPHKAIYTKKRWNVLMHIINDLLHLLKATKNNKKTPKNNCITSLFIISLNALNVVAYCLRWDHRLKLIRTSLCRFIRLSHRSQSLCQCRTEVPPVWIVYWSIMTWLDI